MLPYDGNSILGNFELMFQVLIEYKGFRIVAQSILPINDKTILYGSADGGMRFLCLDKDATRV